MCVDGIDKTETNVFLVVHKLLRLGTHQNNQVVHEAVQEPSKKVTCTSIEVF